MATLNDLKAELDRLVSANNGDMNTPIAYTILVKDDVLSIIDSDVQATDEEITKVIHLIDKAGHDFGCGLNWDVCESVVSDFFRGRG